MESQSPTATRRMIGRRSVIAGAGLLCALPSTWRKPVIDAVVLPAHAQASVIAFTMPTLRNARSQSRIPSGAGAVESLDSIRFSGCLGLPGIEVTCAAVADIGGGIMIDVGTATTTTNNANFFTVDLIAPAINIAPVGSIVEVTITCEALGVTGVATISAFELTGALAGSVNPAPSCG